MTESYFFQHGLVGCRPVVVVAAAVRHADELSEAPAVQLPREAAELGLGEEVR